MKPQWVRSLTTLSSVYGIAINPEKKWIIAHSIWLNPDRILILDPDGNLKGAYAYASSP
jgi:hypothetical protein